MSFFIYGLFVLIALEVIVKTIGILKGNTSTTTITYTPPSENNRPKA